MSGRKLVPIGRSVTGSLANTRPAPAIVARNRTIDAQASTICQDQRSLIPDPKGFSSLRWGSPLPRQNPLEVLKTFVQQWGTENGKSRQLDERVKLHLANVTGLSPELLLFHDSPRLDLLVATPLPPYPTRRDFEDGLIESLVSNDDHTFFKCLDGPRLIDIYSSYRACPESLAEDQSALIYASLCLARYTRIRRGMSGGIRDQETPCREDVTYYRLAKQALATWGDASIISMCTSHVSLNTDARGYLLPGDVCSTERGTRRVW